MFQGCTLYADSDSLIALSGLGRGHAWGSFRDPENEDPENEYVWLVDSLPRDRPVFRIVTYGFDTTVPDSDSNQDLEALASQFRSSLRNIRAKPNVSHCMSMSLSTLLT